MSPRLGGLLVVLAVLLFVRFAVPTNAVGPTVVDAVAAELRVRPVPASAAPQAASADSGAPAIVADDLPGNAFEVRGAPAPDEPMPAVVAAAPPAPPEARSPAEVVSPAAAEPAPPQVIGTYDDGRGLAVFFATPGGTLLAREGSVVADYRVTGITKLSVSLVQVSTQRALQLAVLPGGGS